MDKRAKLLAETGNLGRDHNGYTALVYAVDGRRPRVVELEIVKLINKIIGA